MQYALSPAINKTIFTSQKSQVFGLKRQNSHGRIRELQLSPIHLETRSDHQKQNDYKVQDSQDCRQQQQVQFINSNSIVKRYQLMLITCLIMASIASVKFSTQGQFSYIKNVRNYFNSQLLGNDNRALYEYGDNIDESKTQLPLLRDINEHFVDVVQVINNFTQFDGFTQFQQFIQENVQIEVFYLNAQLYKQSMSIEQFDGFIDDLQMRQFLLGLKQMKFKISFGRNKRVQDLNLTVKYYLSSFMVLNVVLQIQYQPNPTYIMNARSRSIRVIQQLLAFMLLCSYLHNAYTIRVQNNELRQMQMFYPNVETLQTNRAYWCYSLVLLNLVTILNQTYAPMASFLQLLPIFQRHDSANVYKYNFNTNLRYAIPLVLRVFIPVIILLNGFIFYSMVMYPGDYFESYSLGFFSYIYQNFQVGTYEIFTQLQSRGNFAYFLYGILYFYMVLVGNNLFPALFCTMIYIKLYENDLKDHIKKTVNNAVCPKCNHQNLRGNEEQRKFQLNISSPKISPYLRGKLSSAQQKNKQPNLLNKVTKMFVEEQQINHTDLGQYLKSQAEKIKGLSIKLRRITLKQTDSYRQQKYFTEKIQKLAERVSQTISLSPIRSPLNYK